jgi:hypothetical protein
VSRPKSLALCAGLVAGLMCLGCDRAANGTGTVFGHVILRNGDTTDVRGSVVQLRRTQNIADPPAYSGTVDSSDLFYRARFAISGVDPDSYYVLVWKNEDADDSISDGDYVGVFVGSYARNRLGSRLAVSAGDSVDAGSLEIGRLVQLNLEAWGERADSGRATRLYYRFNHDVELELLTCGFPDGDTLPDPGATGPRRADSACATTEWRRGGAPMPRGWYGLVFRGRTEWGDFVRGASVFVP